MEGYIIAFLFLWIVWLEIRLRITMRRLRDVAWAYSRMVEAAPASQRKVMEHNAEAQFRPDGSLQNPIEIASRRKRE